MKVCDRCGAKHAVLLIVPTKAWEPFSNPSTGYADLCQGCRAAFVAHLAAFLPVEVPTQSPTAVIK